MSEKRFNVRARQASDAKSLAVLVNLPGYRYGTTRLPFQSYDEIVALIQKASPSDLELVAVCGDQIVGQGGLQRLAGRRHHAAILGIGVHDDWICRGIGTALLSELLDAADNWLGIRRIELTVFVDNIPAIRLYERFGFKIEGIHQAYALRDGYFVDANTMARIRHPKE